MKRSEEEEEEEESQQPINGQLKQWDVLIAQVES
jgi:hypothetical protein